uniref:Uncharacterized protein n=1 Tax=Candidatus Kentrum sp. MB TaxID=2138164 RepID=A0A450XVX0_9GAMM|nr:MAG: hypothetical protein BECKMB1821G_GA0114241_104320 [Candidatus Kentron sp. MB]VFK33428.1 MAG: hypothetical protein BECKMB1821I_GA0114274_104519 [Candidatus Kentron sp. MB]VFK76162.1 MAG: hypothetical protein BECKMB1821H_GA0114242_104419 [Candidatus Kentron sp. MB]
MIVTFPENPEQNDEKIRRYQEAISPAFLVPDVPGWGKGERLRIFLHGLFIYANSNIPLSHMSGDSKPSRLTVVAARLLRPNFSSPRSTMEPALGRLS